MTRLTGMAALAILAVGFAVLGVLDMRYLFQGYNLGASFEGHAVTFWHIGFPAWLQALHAFVFTGVIATLLLCTRRSVHAAMAGRVASAAALLLGAYDVTEYGTVGSPTSLKMVVLILFLGVLAGPIARRPS